MVFQKNKKKIKTSVGERVFDVFNVAVFVLPSPFAPKSRTLKTFCSQESQPTSNKIASDDKIILLKKRNLFIFERVAIVLLCFNYIFKNTK